MPLHWDWKTFVWEILLTTFPKFGDEEVVMVSVRGSCIWEEWSWAQSQGLGLYLTGVWGLCRAQGPGREATALRIWRWCSFGCCFSFGPSATGIGARGQLLQFGWWLWPWQQWWQSVSGQKLSPCCVYSATSFSPTSHFCWAWAVRALQHSSFRKG